jgi:fatty-acyl-CoA synthase
MAPPAGRRLLPIAVSKLSSRLTSARAYWGDKNDANYTPLTPLSFLKRSAKLFPDQVAYVHGTDDISSANSSTYRELDTTCRVFACQLLKIGIKKSDVVSIIAPNSPAILKAHFAVPAVGAVLHTINTRLDAKSILFQLSHAQTKLILVDTEFAPLLNEVFLLLSGSDVGKDVLKSLKVVQINDPEYSKQIAPVAPTGLNLPTRAQADIIDFDSLIKGSSRDASFDFHYPADEFDPVALNYTSGTTGNPKGVVVHHRGAYLNALGNLLEWQMPRHPRLLFIVPLFHCNGWTFPWSMAASAGTCYFIRQVRPQPIFDIIDKHGINYMAGAPITMLTMLQHPAKFKFAHDLQFWVAGAPPSPAMIKRFSTEIGASVQTVYGLTETYGPISSHVPDQQWAKNGLSAEAVLGKCTYQSHDVTMEDMR